MPDQMSCLMIDLKRPIITEQIEVKSLRIQRESVLQKDTNSYSFSDEERVSSSRGEQAYQCVSLARATEARGFSGTADGSPAEAFITGVLRRGGGKVPLSNRHKSDNLIACTP